MNLFRSMTVSSIAKSSADSSHLRRAFILISLALVCLTLPQMAQASRGGAGNTAELDSWSAKQWQKDGFLVVEIENMVDGNDGSITATRTVVLGFDRSDKAKVLKSTIKFAGEKS